MRYNSRRNIRLSKKKLLASKIKTNRFKTKGGSRRKNIKKYRIKKSARKNIRRQSKSKKIALRGGEYVYGPGSGFDSKEFVDTAPLPVLLPAMVIMSPLLIGEQIKTTWDRKRRKKEEKAHNQTTFVIDIGKNKKPEENQTYTISGDYTDDKYYLPVKKIYPEAFKHGRWTPPANYNVKIPFPNIETIINQKYRVIQRTFDG